MESEKPKQVLSPERLEKLKLAREKALEKKRELKEITEKEKAIKQKEYETRKESVNKKYEEVYTKKPEVKKVAKVIEKKKKKKYETESESESSVSSSSSEEEVVVKRRAHKTKKHLQTKIENKPDSELLNKMTKEELLKRIQQRDLQNAYKSLGFHGSLF